MLGNIPKSVQSFLSMNKDALLATLIGFGIGLLITGAFLFGPTLVHSIPSLSFKLPSFSFGNAKPPISPIPTQTPRVTGLTVTAPLPEAIFENKDLLVSGTAPGGTVVVIASTTDETVVTADDNNAFAAKVILVEGKNDIVVTAYIEKKEEIVSLPVYYTPEDL